ncbi:MAG TPA: proteasome activator [Actinomycetota bacterium]
MTEGTTPEPASRQEAPAEGARVEERTDEPQEAISQPTKLLRIASMVRELLEETRQASLDEPGRVRLRQIYERSLSELAEIISPDLRDELAALAPPMQGVPTDAEIRVAQAQLVGWLEGLFHGIQAALFAQQAAARAQFEELRRRGLPAGQQPPQAPEARGQYL